MNWEAIDWPALERLRAAFLDGSAGVRDYWFGERDLESYDQTFGQRIRWKWDYVLRELERRHWSPPGGSVLDWGCGSGIAGRAFLEHFGTDGVDSLVLFDRSTRAMEFAEQKAREEFPKLTVRTGLPTECGATKVLLSHVLTELNTRQAKELLVLTGEATSLLWVEPGTREVSRRLIEVRERVRGTFHVVAPCTHEDVCGMLAPGNESHWCHHFAPSPPEVFTDGNWARFANVVGVDLRSLPLSFLVLDKRPVPALPPGAVRIIGQSRVHKADAHMFGCDATGVNERRVTKRALPEAFRQLKKGSVAPLQIWRCEDSEVRELKPLD